MTSREAYVISHDILMLLSVVALPPLMMPFTPLALTLSLLRARFLIRYTVLWPAVVENRCPRTSISVLPAVVPEAGETALTMGVRSLR